jgi:hypothetical protein
MGVCERYGGDCAALVNVMLAGELASGNTYSGWLVCDHAAERQLVIAAQGKL